MCLCTFLYIPIACFSSNVLDYFIIVFYSLSFSLKKNSINVWFSSNGEKVRPPQVQENRMMALQSMDHMRENIIQMLFRINPLRFVFIWMFFLHDCLLNLIAFKFFGVNKNLLAMQYAWMLKQLLMYFNIFTPNFNLTSIC